MARSKRAGSTVTLSVSLSPREIAILRRRAKRLHGGNVSAAVADAAELLRIDENRRALAEELERELGPLDDSVMRAVLAETLGPALPARRRKKRVA